MAQGSTEGRKNSMGPLEIECHEGSLVVGGIPEATGYVGGSHRVLEG